MSARGGHPRHNSSHPSHPPRPSSLSPRTVFSSRSLSELLRNLVSHPRSLSHHCLPGDQLPGFPCFQTKRPSQHPRGSPVFRRRSTTPYLRSFTSTRTFTMSSEAPYDPYIPAGSSGAAGGASAQQNGNQRTAALQAVSSLPFSSSRWLSMELETHRHCRFHERMSRDAMSITDFQKALSSVG